MPENVTAAADTVVVVRRPTADQLFVDGYNLQHELVAAYVFGENRCGTCRENWPCRTVLLNVAEVAHPAEGWCSACSDLAPCALRHRLLVEPSTVEVPR